MLAKEPVTFNLALRGDPSAVQRKHDDFFGRGLPITLTPDEVTIIGAPILEHAVGGPLELGFTRKVDAELSLKVKRPSGELTDCLITMPAVIEGGHLEQRCKAELPRAPLSTAFKLEIDAAGNMLTCTLAVPTQRWSGQPIRYLAYFDQLVSLFDLLTEGSALLLECSILGNTAFTFAANACEFDFAAELRDYLALLRKARLAAAELGVDPKLPHPLSFEQVQEIEDLHELLTDGEVRRPGYKTRFTIQQLCEGTRAILAKPASDYPPGPFRSTVKGPTFQFLGEQVDVGWVEFVLSHTDFASQYARLAREFHETDADTFEVVFEGTRDSELLVRRMEEPPDSSTLVEISSTPP